MLSGSSLFFGTKCVSVTPCSLLPSGNETKANSTLSNIHILVVDDNPLNRDVFIDLIGFRALGHNEADEPAATQPMMYSIIRKLKPSHKYYAEKLISEGIISSEDVSKLIKDYRKEIDQGKSVVDLAPDSDPRAKEFKKFETKWKDYLTTKWTEKYDSKIPLNKLINIAKKLEKIPENFTFQKQVGKIAALRPISAN